MKRKIQASELSKTYLVRTITEADISTVYELCSHNPIYYHYCPPFVTKELVLEDMIALPPGKTSEDKYYVGFYEKNCLVAVMDLIAGYPKEACVWIGFFMMNKEFQGKGIGTAIITEACNYLSEVGFEKVQLGYIKGNSQSETFWLKNKFQKTGRETLKPEYTIVVMERLLTQK